MTHGVLTNKFHATYNYEKIDHDFDIFMVTKESKKLNNTNILDIPTANFKALSVQYFLEQVLLFSLKKEMSMNLTSAQNCRKHSMT